ncbi:4-hydroxythreonine-4-phosphate dehydrogenase PdxA [Spirosoma agri]|uniref:4-hydroxythreonine-4-phosphate dehydrogenase PdxA n=1 Tax=Spirosoma agri TaxID=1987381 RepID=A0A6M0IQX9_9BACT|nr:4-hydroxythreonine-4-phosphate dehydrogenase PdxA [Spirosoma agri]
MSPTDRPQQERAPRDANAPERASQERGQRDGTTPDRAQQERGQRQDRDRTPRDTNAPERGTQERGQQERGQRDANRQERQPRDGSQNQRSDSRPTDRDRSTGNRERSASEPRNAGNRDRQPSDNGDFIDDDADSQDRSLRETGTDIRDERLVIGISLGDYNGIGPEVILKALQYNRLQKICTPVIYGSMRVLNRYRNLLNLKDWNLNGAPTIGQISHKMTNVITCWPDQNQDIQPGQVTADAGQAALACLQRAVDDLKEGKLDALVTAPINKYNIQSDEFKFPGHTEYLAQEFGVDDNLMFLVSERLRVGVVTGHVPLGRVRQNVTKERISQKLSLMMASLRQDFGIEKPKIAVLGLNPHAGEEGLLGNEEQDIIKPVIAEWRNKGQMVFGPYPADGFFGTRGYLKFDAVLAMYHDQGLIPFKAIAFEDGVNFTAGMPAVRTSPDHGTAYDIAGKNLADETSMLQAIYTAIDVARQRKEFADLEENSLSNQSVEK